MNKKSICTILFFIILTLKSFGQINKPYTSSFIGRMGVDTVLVETYTIINNHLYGKAFVRVPEDYIAEFSVHFYPDGSIREFNINAMNPLNSSVPFEANSSAFEYRLNMNCKDDACIYYNSDPTIDSERVITHSTKSVDFVGGWVPLISLMEWNCMRLAQSTLQSIPLKMINHNIGVYDIGIHYQDKETMIFGGPFLEYTKINTDSVGKILSVNGIGTPWNYFVTKHSPINIEEISKRMSKSKGIGIPSPTETINAEIQNSTIEIKYGRPFKRGRTIFGGVVPYDSLWRTGANGPTTITLNSDIKIKNDILQRGTYSIFTIPNPTNWELIFSSDITSWPTNPDRTKDFLQTTIPIQKSDLFKEQFTIEIKESIKGGQIFFKWDDVEAILDFEIIKER